MSTSRRGFLKVLFGGAAALALYGKVRPLLGPLPESRPAPPNEDKQRILSEYLSTAEGRSKLAASMVQPLRVRRDYAAVGRKVFSVNPLPPGY